MACFVIIIILLSEIFTTITPGRVQFPAERTSPTPGIPLCRSAYLPMRGMFFSDWFLPFCAKFPLTAPPSDARQSQIATGPSYILYDIFRYLKNSMRMKPEQMICSRNGAVPAEGKEK
jgi:hypothetical protein